MLLEVEGMTREKTARFPTYTRRRTWFTCDDCGEKVQGAHAKRDHTDDHERELDPIWEEIQSGKLILNPDLN